MCIKDVKMKKRYNFTLDEDLMDWFKSHAKKNRTKCSAVLNQYLFKLYLEYNKKPKNVITSVPTEFN
jgi:hypothetical protein